MPGPHCYEYPRASTTVDLVVFGWRDTGLHVLLIERKHEPFAGRWAIPGGFLEMNEEPDAGARRELTEETGLEAGWPVQPLGFFAQVGRDPRGRTISLAYASIMRPPLPSPLGADDASRSAWLPVADCQDLAFDHDQILAVALQWLRTAVLEGPAGVELLPRPCTDTDVRTLFRNLYGNVRQLRSWVPRMRRAGLLEGGTGPAGPS